MANGEAIIYVRVSTEEQARSGLGAEAQTAACVAFCNLRGYTVLQVVKDEGVSGRDDPEGREGMGEVLAYTKAHPDVRVVVYALSRLSRRQSHIWRLLDDKGPWALRLESASEAFDTTSPMGRAMLGMLGVWAQLEADMCSDRTRTALAARKARGFRLGPRYTIEVDPDLCADIAAMRENGYSCSRIAHELNAQGVPGIRGGRWHETSVRRVLDQFRKAERDRKRDEAARGGGGGAGGDGGAGARVESSGATGDSSGAPPEGLRDGAPPKPDGGAVSGEVLDGARLPSDACEDSFSDPRRDAGSGLGRADDGSVDVEFELGGDDYIG